MRKKRRNILLYIFSIAWLFEGLVLFYRKCISPLMANVCVFTPSCSNYMLIALRRFGPVKGIALGTRRLLRCQPWAKGGLDPVPNKMRDYYWLY